jgi:hypothetical protein
MEDASGIELSLLEGMDESLLARLHAAGIRTRRGLGERIAGPDGRRRLAQELGISPRRLQILHYLNYLLPEERVEHVFDLERKLEDRCNRIDREFRQLWRVVTGVSIGVLGLVLVLFILFRPTGPGGDPQAEARITALEGEVAALRPIGVAYAEDSVVRALSRLGPAPGWSGPIGWSAADDRNVDRLLGGDRAYDPPRALSLALHRLDRIESASPDSLTPLDRARQASSMLADLPPITQVATMWDAAAVLVRSRVRSRAFGLDPQKGITPPVGAALPWGWTTPAFLTCEEILTRLEALPVAPDVLGEWSEALLELRADADRGRQALAGKPEASARDYWLRRGELEMAVTAALAGRRDLLPYSGATPRGFLEERRGYLQHAIDDAPPTARPSLTWLVVEHEEALALMAWLDAHPPAPAAGGGAVWVETLADVETERAKSPEPVDPRIEAAVARALAAAGVPGDPWSSSLTRREASLRPLLMEARAATRAR